MALNASVHIKVLNHAGINLPVKTYFTHPFKVLNITEDIKEGLLRLMLMSSSPGILDGDKYNILVELAENCSLELQTQSYQRLFQMKTGALQETQFRLGKNSFFRFIQHPVVPHQFSNFTSSNKIFLSDGCTLVWGEVFTCGRKLNGEIFHFTSYQSVTEIFLNGRLMIKENLLMQPALIQSAGIGQLEGFTHQATLIFLDPVLHAKEGIKTMSDLLDQQKQIIYGITSAPLNGIIVRILGNKAEQLFDCLKAISLAIKPVVNIKL